MADNDLDTGLVQAGEYSVGGDLMLRVTTSEDYTSITFGDLTFFFDREDGQYDGWGKDCENRGIIKPER